MFTDWLLAVSVAILGITTGFMFGFALGTHVGIEACKPPVQAQTVPPPNAAYYRAPARWQI